MKLCQCGQPCMSMYVDVFGLWVHTKWCPACEAAGKLVDIRNQRMEKRDKFYRMINRAIPADFRCARVKHIPASVKALLKTKKEGQGIYFWGDVGRGKTYVASALLRNFILRGKTAKGACLKDIIEQLRATFSSNHESEKDIYQRYIRTDLLFIDDIGTAKNGNLESDYNQEVLLKLIGRRADQKKMTIVTSNLSPENILAGFGKRIFSRLHKFLIIGMTGRDRRQERK